MGKRLVALCAVLILSAGCATLRPAPIVNPSLSTVGKTAVRAAQIINALDIAQRQIEPLVDAEVLTVDEGLNVAKSFGVALEQAKSLVAVLTLADAATSVIDRMQELQRATSSIKALMRTMQGSVAGVGRLSGRIVVGALAGSVTDAVGDLVPELSR